MAKTEKVYTHIMLTLDNGDTFGHIYAEPITLKADGTRDYGYVSFYDELPIASCQMDTSSAHSYAYKSRIQGSTRRRCFTWNTHV